MKRETMTTRRWLGWHVGWLFLNGKWEKSCFTATEAEARNALRQTARRLRLMRVPADVTRGALPDWTPEQSALQVSNHEEK
jgi:hypothetical protein